MHVAGWRDTWPASQADSQPMFPRCVWLTCLGSTRNAQRGDPKGGTATPGAALEILLPYPDLCVGDREALSGLSRLTDGTTKPVLHNGASDAPHGVSSACGRELRREHPLVGEKQLQHPVAALQTNKTRVQGAKNDSFIGYTGFLCTNGAPEDEEWHRASTFKGFPPPLCFSRGRGLGCRSFPTIATRIRCQRRTR